MAPLAEITTPALRKIVRSYSAEVHLFSEMLSAASIVNGGFHNSSRSTMYDFDPPFSYQLLGNDPAVMAEAVRILSADADVSVDINFGCSAPDIRRRGQGAALLTDITLASRIVSACRAVTCGMLSVKVRAGYEQIDPHMLRSFAQMAEDEGVDFITVHPRCAKQRFARKADWSVIQCLTEETALPVIGNGDISDERDACAKKRESGCHGIMIGRAAVASPWIFNSYTRMVSGNSDQLTIDLERISSSFITNLLEYVPPVFYRTRAHRFYGFFCSNFTYTHELFSKIRRTDDPKMMHALISDYLLRNPDERTVIC